MWMRKCKLSLWRVQGMQATTRTNSMKRISGGYPSRTRTTSKRCYLENLELSHTDTLISKLFECRLLPQQLSVIIVDLVIMEPGQSIPEEQKETPRS